MDKLAFGIAALVNLALPQAVVISGGLCVHEELVVAPLEREVYRQGYWPGRGKNNQDTAGRA